MNESYGFDGDGKIDAVQRLYLALNALPKHDSQGPSALFSCVHKILCTEDLINLQNIIKERFPKENPLVSMALDSIEGELALRSLL